MLMRYVLIFLALFAAGSLCAAVPQPWVIHRQAVVPAEPEAQGEEEGEAMEVTDTDLSAPPPVMRTAPMPMGLSPLSVPPIVPAPVQAAPIPVPVPVGREPFVEKDQLAAPVLTMVGILDERGGALPMDIWKKLSYSQALNLLTSMTQRLDAGGVGDIASDLVRLSALSRTYEPSGDPSLARNFFNARVMAAQGTGDRAGAIALLNTQPASFTAQDWKAFLDKDIRERRLPDACAVVGDKLAQDPAKDVNVYAQKLGILCDIRAGKADSARLHLDVLREAGDGDTLFLDLSERALAPNVTPKKQQALKLENLSTVHVAALALGKAKLKPEQIDRLMATPQPILLDIPMGEAPRMKYAEQFARSGQISAQDYVAIVNALKFPPKAIEGFRANPDTLLTVPEKEWPAPLRRAAALRAIAEEETMSQKTRIITAAMTGLSNAELLGPLGDALAAQVSDIPALPDHAAAAPAMARLALLRGQGDAANWWRLASAAPSQRDALLPLFPLALLRGVIGDDDRLAWFERYGRTQAFSSEKKSQNFAMLKLLGVILPTNEESQIAAQGVLPSVTTNDQRLDVILSNLQQGSSEAIMRAAIALKAMRQDHLAEKLVLENL